MFVPTLSGVIDRRLLINFRVDPRVLAAILPPPFRPQIVAGYGLAGICLIRLRHVRPRHWPRWLGLASENAAHRVAVEWEERGQIRSGVYILRRDTDSRLNALAGGRIFPGTHHHAAFRVQEQPEQFKVEVRTRRETLLRVEAQATDQWSAGSVFNSLPEASAFFQNGASGYSAASGRASFQGLALRCQSWHVEPLAVSLVKSLLFDDLLLFPAGTIQLDCGLLMRGIEHEWQSLPALAFPALACSAGACA